MRYGYACINLELSYPQKYGGKEKGVQPVTTGRTMIKKTFDSKGVDYASELTLQNVKDLNQIISWNVLNDYDFYRMSSGLAPWKTEYEWSDLKDIDQIKQWFHSAGVIADTHNIRLTSHPGPFNVLVSPHDHVVDNCIKDLTIHGDEFDMMGLSRTPYNKINIHIGGVYGDKKSAMERFCKNFERLPESVKSRLTVENRMVDVRLTYDKGLDRYYGLLDLALAFDVFKKQGTRILLPTGKTEYGKTINNNPEKYFTDDVMEQLEVVVNEYFKYGKSKTGTNDSQESSS